MRVLVIDQQGAALDFCWRAQKAGHAVHWWMRDNPKTRHIGEGLIKKVPDWREWYRWADLIFLADNTVHIEALDALRRNDPGPLICGPTASTARWELDRTYGQEILKKAGIETIPYREFQDYDRAIAYVMREMCPFVSKPIGDEPDKSLSYVAKDPADLVYMLERWKRSKKLKGAFILQKKVSGCEMAVGGWFGPAGWCPGWHENWEHKKLMNGDMGPNTGESGTVVRVVEKSKLADQMLVPLTDRLAAEGYVGYIDVNTIIDDDGQPWPLEFTIGRPGWPTFNIQQALIDGDPVRWIASLTEGSAFLPPWRKSVVAVGVVLSIPDYPYSHITRKEVVGIPIYGEIDDEPNHSTLHGCEIMLSNSPCLVQDRIVDVPTWATAGDYVLVATGLGETVQEARRHVYQRLKRLSVPNSPMWRTDIGTRLSRQLPNIQSHGYATGLIYSQTS